MIRVFGAVLLTLFFALPAAAQTCVGFGGQQIPCAGQAVAPTIGGGIPTSAVGQPNGVAGLDANGLASALNVLPLNGTTPRSLAALMSDRINVKSFGAAGNAQRSTMPQTLPVGSRTLTSAAPLFTASDVGKTIVVAGAGASGGALTTTITGYTSGTVVTLAAAGVTLPPTSTTAGNYLLMWGNDDTAAMQAAVAAANTKMAAGQYPCIYAPGASYMLSAPPGSFAQGMPGCVEGDGPVHTAFWLTPSFAGNVFDWSEAWIPTVSGPQMRNFRIDGWPGAPAQQNGMVLYDRNDNLTAENIDVWTMPGRGFYAGSTKNTTQAYLRESHNLTNLRFFGDGAPGVPAVELTSQNTSGTNSDATNTNSIRALRIYGSNGPSLVIRNASATSMGGLTITDAYIEGTENGTTAADLVTIGDPVMTGIVNGVTFKNLSLIDPYGGYAALRLTASSKATSPYGVTVDGGIGGGGMNAGAKGLVIDAAGGANGAANRFRFSNISTTGANVTVGNSTVVNGRIFLDGNGTEGAWTYAVDTTTAGLITNNNGTRQGLPNATPATVANYHDGSPGGGNVAAAGCVDLQQTRFSAVQTCQTASGSIGGGANNTTAAQFAVISGGNANTDAGFGGFIGGGNNNVIVSGSFHSMIGGQYNSLSGYASTILGGQYGTDRGRTAWTGFAAGRFSVTGDAQTGRQVLRGAGAAATAIRLTSDGGAAGAANVDTIPTNTHYHTRVSASCRDTTAAGWASWDALGGDMDRATGSASYTGGYTTATAPTRSAGTLTGMTLTLAADTTNQGLNVSATPAAGNTDTIHCVALTETTEEVQ